MKEGACRREITEVFDLSQSDGGDWVEDALMFCPRLWKCQAGSWGTRPGGAPSWGPWWFPESTQRRRGGCGREAGAGLKRVQQAKQDNLSVQNKNMQCVLTVTRKNVCVHGGI